MDEDYLSPEAWAAVDGMPGWLVLMDHAHGYRQARLVVSDVDKHFLVQSVRTLYPGERVEVVSDDQRRYLIRQPVEVPKKRRR